MEMTHLVDQSTNVFQTSSLQYIYIVVTSELTSTAAEICGSKLQLSAVSFATQRNNNQD